MRVRDLMEALRLADPEATIEFRDVTTGRECPVNSYRHEASRDKAPIQNGRVVLSNRLT